MFTLCEVQCILSATFACFAAPPQLEFCLDSYMKIRYTISLPNNPKCQCGLQHVVDIAADSLAYLVSARDPIEIAVITRGHLGTTLNAIVRKIRKRGECFAPHPHSCLSKGGAASQQKK